jgi:hypothetical protein
VDTCVNTDVLEVDTAAVFFAGVKNCTDSVHKFSRAFLLCYESVQFLTPAKQLAAISPVHAKVLVVCIKKIKNGPKNVA